MSRSMAALMSFEVIPGAVAVHAGQLVAIEQREGPGEVWVRDPRNRGSIQGSGGGAVSDWVTTLCRKLRIPDDMSPGLYWRTTC